MTTTQERAKPAKSKEPPPSRRLNTPVARLDREECLVNLTGDYSYMSDGYYTSQDQRHGGQALHPSNREALDAYVIPVFLERAKLAGLPVPEWYITNEHFEAPAIVDTINPFMTRQSVVLKQSAAERVSKSMTRNFTYAICCQELPRGSSIRTFRAVLGWTSSPQYQELADRVWRVFRIPLATVRVIVTPDGRAMLSALRPLPFKKLTVREFVHLQSVVTWRT